MTRAAAVAAALLLLPVGCFGPRWERETFHESGAIEVLLRSREGARPAYDHPVTVSAIRMTHILASLDVRMGDDEKKNARTPAVPVELVFALGDLVSQALEEADATQHVVVMAERTTRSLKIFTEKRLTSFVVYMKDDQLHVHLSRLDWPVPKNPNTRIHEPVPGKEVMEFTVLGGRSILRTGPQSVAVAWRDETFRRADSVRLLPGGRVQRRTILMEEPPEEAPEPPAEEGLDWSSLPPETLRELADLEEARRAGRVSEAEYRARRDAILERAGR